MSTSPDFHQNSERKRSQYDNLSNVSKPSSDDKISSSSYIELQNRYNDSFRYCERLLELIEKRTQLMENIPIDSSEQLSDIMPPTGMDVLNSDVSNSSLNDGDRNQSRRPDGNLYIYS